MLTVSKLKKELTVFPGNDAKIWFSLYLHRKVEFRNWKIESARLLNAIAKASDYASGDPQEGIAIEAFCKFFLSY